MSEAFLVAQDLHRSFNHHKAVDGVSFTIYQGEIFGLLGPNGAGKTTTIRMLSTVLEPDQGDVTIAGHSVRQDAAAVRRLIGTCPQELALYEDLSAMDNLVFFGRMRPHDDGLVPARAFNVAAEFGERLRIHPIPVLRVGRNATDVKFSYHVYGSFG